MYWIVTFHLQGILHFVLEVCKQCLVGRKGGYYDLLVVNFWDVIFLVRVKFNYVVEDSNQSLPGFTAPNLLILWDDSVCFSFVNSCCVES